MQTPTHFWPCGAVMLMLQVRVAEFSSRMRACCSGQYARVLLRFAAEDALFLRPGSDQSSCGRAGAGVAAEGDAQLPQELPVGPRRGRPPGARPLCPHVFLKGLLG